MPYRIRCHSCLLCRLSRLHLRLLLHLHLHLHPLLPAGIAPDGPQLGTPKTAKIFNKNFWADFSASLGSGHAIKDFTKCDFAAIRAHLDAQRAVKKGASKEDKDAAKSEKERLQLQVRSFTRVCVCMRVCPYMHAWPVCPL